MISMDPVGFPPVPDLLLNALDRAFPERSAMSPDQTHAHLLFEGGKREVVRFLQARFKEQQAAATELNQHVLVHPARS